MKSLLLLVLAAALFTGCSKVVDINNPTQQDKHEFLKLNLAPESGVEWIMGAGKYIDGSKGGFVSFSKNYISEAGRRISVNLLLTVPAGAYNGKTTVGFTMDSETGVLDFYPTPMSFNIPLKLDYTISGVDLSNVNCNLIDFYYLDSNKYVKVNYSSISVDQATGTLTVNDALLDHFSRYGWGTIVDPTDPSVVTD